MRAGPLSQQSMIDVLNSLYVPVYASTEYFLYDKNPAPPAERAAFFGMRDAFSKRGLPVSTVCIYLMTPDGTPISSMYIAPALKDPDALLRWLKDSAAQQKVVPGPPVVRPHPLSAPPKAKSDALVLHLVARGLEGGSWQDLPSENWIVWGPDLWAKLLPPAGAAVNSTYNIPDDIARRLLAYCYPSTEDAYTDDSARSHIQQVSLRGRLLATTGGDPVRVRLEGAVQMQRDFYHDRPDPSIAKASLLGFLDVTTDRSRPPYLEMATTSGNYGPPGGKQIPYAAAYQSVAASA